MKKVIYFLIILFAFQIGNADNIGASKYYVKKQKKEMGLRVEEEFEIEDPAEAQRRISPSGLGSYSESQQAKEVDYYESTAEENTIYIEVDGDYFKIFNKNGKYTNRYIKHNSHLTYIGNNSNFIILFDSKNDEYLIYDSNGNFTGNKFKCKSYKFRGINNKSIYFNCWFDEDKYQYIYDLQGKLIKKVMIWYNSSKS